jgi:ABC-2 type transport system permease protein
MLPLLIAKDLRRATRHPVRWVLPFLVPLLITGLIGLAFGSKSGGGTLGTVKVAIVDEGDSVLAQFLQRMPKRPDEAMPFELDTQFLSREEAMKQITENALSAVVVIPAGFEDALLGGTETITLEIIKNPAQAIHPAIVEEGLRVLITVMNTAARVLGGEAGEWRELLESDDEFYVKFVRAAQLLEEAGSRLEPVQAYLSPPLVGFTSETQAATPVADDAGPEFNLFGYLLIGMAAMFMLYTADNGMRDLYQEAQASTLERFKTMHEGLAVMIASKVLYAMVLVVIAATIFFVGGGFLFQITWERPCVLVVLVVAYSFFAAGFLGLISAIAGNEKRADVLNNIMIMLLALAGGAMFPPQGLPDFVRDIIMPWMPTAWFAMTVRDLQDGNVSMEWILAAGKLAGLGVLLIGLSARLLNLRMEKGVRP